MEYIISDFENYKLAGYDKSWLILKNTPSLKRPCKKRSFFME